MYRMESVKVDTLLFGVIDCTDFEHKVSERKDKPAILNVNIGTAVKGAVDDLDLVLKTLEKVGYTKDLFYIHVDDALFGLMMSFVRKVWGPPGDKLQQGQNVWNHSSHLIVMFCTYVLRFLGRCTILSKRACTNGFKFFLSSHAETMVL